MGPISLLRLAVWLSALSGAIAAPVVETDAIEARDEVEARDVLALDLLERDVDEVEYDDDFDQDFDEEGDDDLVARGIIQARRVIGHDKVVGFPTSVPGGSTGSLFKKFQPFLKVRNGCVPFPAVNKAGDTSGGLKATGSPSGKCSKNKGQVYGRLGKHNGYRAIMYSWYMPKDSPQSGRGHRHGWESVVVWINNSGKPFKVSISKYGGKYEWHGASKVKFSPGPQIMINAVSNKEHVLYLGSEKGGQQPLVVWEKLTNAARKALENTDFGTDRVPFNNKNFGSNLRKAW